MSPAFSNKFYSILLAALFLAAVFFIYNCQENDDRPNIVWLVTEDNSVHYSDLYDSRGANMPSINFLKENGLLFLNTFSNAPVCSVARSTIISGCYAPRTGTQYHRKMQKVPMPDGLSMFPYYLREAGYYTSNNAKEDYNYITSEGTWDASSRQATYRDRINGQPFFHVQNFGVTHEGQLHFDRADLDSVVTSMDPDSISVFPYLPNTSLSRYTFARSVDNHLKADIEIGQFIDQLKEEGLLDNTIIFYFGDHGGVLPRSKGYLYESGLHVPLIVYVPKQYQSLSPFPVGNAVRSFIQFVDFAPTVLQLAGIDIPTQMDGQPFMGAGISDEELNERSYAFSYADRFDEKYDLVRAVRKGKYKYIRNYQPSSPDGLFNYYRYKMLAFREWQELFQKGMLNDVQQRFFLPNMPEELYDLEEDPDEINNLANDAGYDQMLQSLRDVLKKQVVSMPDLSFIPESDFLSISPGDPVAFGREHAEIIRELVATADLSLLDFREAAKGIEAALGSDNSWVRYWGLIVCSHFGKEAASYYEIARELARNDASMLNRMRAFEFLALSDQAVPPDALIDLLAQASSEAEANLMLHSIALMETVRQDVDITIPKSIFPGEWLDQPGDLVNRRIDFINGQVVFDN